MQNNQRQWRLFHRGMAWTALFAALCKVTSASQTPQATSILFTLSTKQARSGDVVTLDVGVSPYGSGCSANQPNVPTCPNGEVVFYEGTKILGTAQLAQGGSAHLKLCFGVGTHELSVHFLGTSSYLANQSKAMLTVLGDTATATTLALSNNAGSFGLTSTVTSSGLTPLSGSVSFVNQTNGNKLLGTSQLGASNVTQSFPKTALSGTAGYNTLSSMVADINDDGYPDLVTGEGSQSDLNAGAVGVRLGTSNGSFQPEVLTTLSGVPLSLAVGDFNHDGHLDVVASTNHSTVMVFLGAGNGSFQSSSSFHVGDGPRSVAVADLNNDGFLDLVTANSNSNTVSVLLGKGDGTFGSATNYAVDSNPGSIAVGDVDKDGIADLAVAIESAPEIDVLSGQGNGKFSAALAYSLHVAVGGSPPGAAYITFADTVGNSSQRGLPPSDSWFAFALDQAGEVYEMTTDHGFTLVEVAGVGNSAITLGDFNNDGTIDLATSQSGNLQLFKSPSGVPTAFTNASSYPVGESPTTLNAADLKGDGFLDIVGTDADQVPSAIVLTNQMTQSATVQLNIGLLPNRSRFIANYSGDASHLPSSSPLLILP